MWMWWWWLPWLFNAKYPDCDAIEPYHIGGGFCEEEHNTEKVLCDGGDCCRVEEERPRLGDGEICHREYCNTREYNSDCGDWNDSRGRYLECPEIRNEVKDQDGQLPAVIGNGICTFVAECMIA